MAKRKRQDPKVIETTVRLEDIKVPTRLLHSELSPEQSALCRYTYKHAGRFMYGNYEQWESGFLREMDPDSELIHWMRVVAVLKHLSPSTEADVQKIMGEMAIGPWPQRIIDAWEQIKGDCQKFVDEAVSDYENGSQE